jgi:ABC-2 type transport system permease protein
MSTMRNRTASVDWMLITRLELRQLARSLALWVSLVVVLLLGGAAALHGASRVARERSAIALLEPALREQVSYLTRITAAEDDLGLLLYYLAMPVSQEPSAWAPAAAGLRGIHPESRHLRFTGLVPQLYQAEVRNPAAEHAGHLDLAYVLSFLLPLWIIGLSYDVRSRDSDLGTAALVRSQPLRLSQLIALRLALKATLVAAVALVLLAFAAFVFRAPLDARALALVVGVLCYVGITFLAVFFVASWNRSSVFNAMLLSGGWIGGAVLLPALVNLAMLVAWPVRGGIELTLEQRLDMNGRWDDPKATTMTPFFARRPEWAGTVVPGDRFSWPWYYAAHEMGDQSVAPTVATYRASLEQRARWTARAGLVLPPLGVELLFERLAGSDLTTALHYRDSIAGYHERLKQTFYPWVFGFQGLAAFRQDELPRHRFVSDEIGGSLPGLPGLVAYLLVLSALAPLAARRLDGIGGGVAPARARGYGPPAATAAAAEPASTDEVGPTLADRRSSEG